MIITYTKVLSFFFFFFNYLSFVFSHFDLAVIIINNITYLKLCLSKKKNLFKSFKNVFRRARVYFLKEYSVMWNSLNLFDIFMWKIQLHEIRHTCLKYKKQICNLTIFIFSINYIRSYSMV